MKISVGQKLVIFMTIIMVSILWKTTSVLFEQHAIINFPPSGTNIVALGDSLTEGTGASSKENGYVGVLAQRLNVDITNAGVRGDTTGSALLRLDQDVLSLHPDIVIVLLGGNDYLTQVPQEETFKNLRMIIERIQKEGAVVLLLGTRGGALHDKFADDFDKLGAESGSAFVQNVLDGIIGNPALLSDEVHPNDEGYLKMADKIAPTLESLVLSAPTDTP